MGKYSNIKKHQLKHDETAAPEKKATKKGAYADDRPKAIKYIDNFSKVIALILALMFFIDIHVLFGGGGYEESVIVPLFGYSDSTVAESYMKPEIPDKSIVFVFARNTYKVGDIVQYNEDNTNPVKRVIEVSEDRQTFVVKGDSEDKETTVEKKQMVGKVFMHLPIGYGFLKHFHTILGAAVTLLLSLFLVCLGDILMIKRRKAELDRREAEAEAKRNKNKKKGDTAPENEGVIGDVIDTSVERKKKKAEKLQHDRENVQKDMEALREKMLAEEAELEMEKKDK